MRPIVVVKTSLVVASIVAKYSDIGEPPFVSCSVSYQLWAQNIHCLVKLLLISLPAFQVVGLEGLLISCNA